MAETFCFFLALFVLLLWQSVFYCTSICHTHFSHSFHSRSSSASIVSLGFATKYASASEQWLPMPADTPGQAGGTEEERDELSSMATCTAAAVRRGEGEGRGRVKGERVVRVLGMRRCEHVARQSARRLFDVPEVTTRSRRSNNQAH